MIKMVSIKRRAKEAPAQKKKASSQASKGKVGRKKMASKKKTARRTAKKVVRKRAAKKSSQKARVSKKIVRKRVSKKASATKTATKKTVRKARKRRALMTVGARKVKRPRKSTTKKVVKRRTVRKAVVKKVSARKVTKKRTAKKTTKRATAKKVTRKRTAKKATSKTVGRTPRARKPKRVAKKATNKKVTKVTRKRTARKVRNKKAAISKRKTRKVTAKKRVAKRVTRRRAAKKTAQESAPKKRTSRKRTARKRAVKRVARKRIAKKVTRKRVAKKRIAKKSAKRTTKRRTAKKRATKRRTSKKRVARKVTRRRKRTARKATRRRTSKSRVARKVTRRRRSRVAKKRTARKVTRRRRTVKRRRTVGEQKKRSSLARRGYMSRKPSVRVRRNRKTVSGLRWPANAASWKRLLVGALPVVGGAVAPNALWGLLNKILNTLIPAVGQGSLGLGSWLASQPGYILALENLLLAYFAHSLRGPGEGFWSKANDGFALGLLIKAVVQLVRSLAGNGALGNALSANIGPLTVGSWPLISADELAARKVDLDAQLSDVLDQLAGVDYARLNLDQQALYEAVQANVGEASARSDLIAVAIDGKKLDKAAAAWSDARTSLAIAQSMLAGLLAAGPIQQAQAQQLMQQAQQMAQQQARLQQPQQFGLQQFGQQMFQQQLPYGGQQQGLAVQFQGQQPQAQSQFQMTPGMYPQRQQQPQVVLGQTPAPLTLGGQEIGPAPDPAAVVSSSGTVGAFLNIDSLMSWSNWLAAESGRDQNDILTAYLLRFVGNNGKNWRFGPYQVTAATVSGAPVGAPGYVGQEEIAARLSVGQLPVMWTDTSGNVNINQCSTDGASIRGMVNTLMGLPIGA